VLGINFLGFSGYFGSLIDASGCSGSLADISGYLILVESSRFLKCRADINRNLRL